MNPPALCLRGSRRRGLPRNPAGGEKAEPSGGDMPVQPSSYLITLSHKSQFKGQRRVLTKPMR